MLPILEDLTVSLLRLFLSGRVGIAALVSADVSLVDYVIYCLENHELLTNKNYNIVFKSAGDLSVHYKYGIFFCNGCIDKCKIISAWSAAKEYSLTGKEL